MAALLATFTVARADDEGIPGAAVAEAVMTFPTPSANVDYAPTGATDPKGASNIEPALPPEAPAPVAENFEPSVADRLPFVIDALVAQSGRLPALGAGDWRAAREALRRLYAERALQPIWVEGAGLNAAGLSLLARLKRAGEDGLDLKPFALPEADISEKSPQRLAEIEADLSAAAAVYALEASGARIAPASISQLVGPKVEVVDPLAALTEIAAAADPGQRLQAFNPPQPGYRLLREKLAQIGAPKTASAVPPSPGLFRNRIEEAPRLGAALARVASARSISSDAEPAVAVAMTGGLSGAQRAAIEANMEMWRWEPREMGSDRIEINVPDFTLKLYKNDAEADHARVIVGKPATPTPIFSNTVKYLLVNPIWRVPESIVKKEMLPKAGGDPSYLEKHGFTVKEIHGQIFVEQPPGEANALGRLLFMFPNEYSVYLHDTPGRSLFAAANRALSHGCVRVEQPMRLAAEVMGGAPGGWSAEKIEGLLGPNERAVFLPRQLPIHIEYFTEFVDDSGALREREDIYGLTSRVAATLKSLGQD
jgi:murein L,D-transpeptidase YcbB/YkuD